MTRVRGAGRSGVPRPAGGRGRLPALVVVHGPALNRFSRRLMPEPGLGQDLAQETLLRAFVSLPRLEARNASARGCTASRQISGPLVVAPSGALARLPGRPRGGVSRCPPAPGRRASGDPGAGGGGRGADPSPGGGDELAARPRWPVSSCSTTSRALSYAEVAPPSNVPVSTVKGRLLSPAPPAPGPRPGWARGPATRKVPRPRRRKGVAAMRTQQTDRPWCRLVLVTVDSISASGMEPTLERIRGALQNMLLPAAEPDQAAPAPEDADLTPVAEQLLALLGASRPYGPPPAGSATGHPAQGGGWRASRCPSSSACRRPRRWRCTSRATRRPAHSATT